jgi:hypothetical protein
MLEAGNEIGGALHQQCFSTVCVLPYGYRLDGHIFFDLPGVKKPPEKQQQMPT